MGGGGGEKCQKVGQGSKIPKARKKKSLALVFTHKLFQTSGLLCLQSNLSRKILFNQARLAFKDDQEGAPEDPAAE